MKNNKGITLIALVVTIIVLLILAGVSIAMLTGQNGILNRAREARENSAAGTLDEATKIVVGNYLTKNLQWVTLTGDDKTQLESDINAVTSSLKATATYTASTGAEATKVPAYFTITASDTTGSSSKSQTVYLNAETGAVTSTAPTASK